MKKKGNLKQEGYRKLIADYVEKTVQQTLEDLFPEVEIKVGTFNLMYISAYPNECLVTVGIQEKPKLTKTKGKKTIKMNY